MAAIANLLAKEKGDALAKQAIVFYSPEQLFRSQPIVVKLCAILSLLRGNACYM